jgi:hypothetical protein
VPAAIYCILPVFIEEYALFGRSSRRYALLKTAAAGTALAESAAPRKLLLTKTRLPIIIQLRFKSAHIEFDMQQPLSNSRLFDTAL